MKKSTIVAIVIVVAVVLLGCIGIAIALNQQNTNTGSNPSGSGSVSSGSEEGTSTLDILKQATSLADIDYDSDKINIYFFWGNGCSVCESFLNFMVDNYADYQQYFNFYAFEVWYNEDNHALFEAFADELGATANAVPFYVIGTKHFTGFSSSKSEEVLNTIISEYENRESADPTVKDFLQNYAANTTGEGSESTGSASESSDNATTDGE